MLFRTTLICTYKCTFDCDHFHVYYKTKINFLSFLFQQALNKLASSPGTLQKIAVFAQNLNTTTLGQTLLATAGRVAQNMIIKQASTALPASMTDMINNYMLSMGSGGLDITVRTMLNQVSSRHLI